MRMTMVSNSSFSPMEPLIGNSSAMQPGGDVGFPKDSFSNAMTKNIVAMIVWLVLNVINGSMVYTFMKHRYTLTHAHTRTQTRTHTHTHTHTHTDTQAHTGTHAFKHTHDVVHYRRIQLTK